MKYDVTVRKQGPRTWGVYGVSIREDGTRNDVLLEGGFFELDVAHECAADYLRDMVEGLERAAGWDPKP